MEANYIYSRLLNRHPNHPGIHYNRMAAYLIAGNGDASKGIFDETMRSCSNYDPTIAFNRRLQDPRNAGEAQPH